MTANNSYRPQTNSSPRPGVMSRADESVWSGARALITSDAEKSSRETLIEARGYLTSIEREYMDLSAAAEKATIREAEAVERRAAELRAQAWAIDREAETRVSVLRKQAKLENDLADRIRDIAERSALSVLDRIKEASDSMMDWAGVIGDDLSGMLRQEAAEQVSRKVADIQAVHEAMEDEARAVELLGLATRYRDRAA